MCAPPACDAGGGLAVSLPITKGFRLNCAQTFTFDVEAQCGAPPYSWSLLDGGYPWIVEFSPKGNDVVLVGMIFDCDVTPAVFEVNDNAGHHATASVVIQ